MVTITGNDSAWQLTIVQEQQQYLCSFKANTQQLNSIMSTLKTTGSVRREMNRPVIAFTWEALGDTRLTRCTEENLTFLLNIIRLNFLPTCPTMEEVRTQLNGHIPCPSRSKDCVMSLPGREEPSTNSSSSTDTLMPS